MFLTLKFGKDLNSSIYNFLERTLSYIILLYTLLGRKHVTASLSYINKYKR